MTKWRWIDRTFDFGFPEAKLPELLERLRGTPARIEEAVGGLDAKTLTYHDGRGWSIQENIGHISDPEELASTRLDQILAGEAVLVAADMTNRKTNEANYNAMDIAALLADFRTKREKLIARFEVLDESDWGKSALHPRLQQPMRIVDIAYFNAEHDDYHLARIRQLIRTAETARRTRVE